MSARIVPPSLDRSRFSCPFCFVYGFHNKGTVTAGSRKYGEITITRCSHCNRFLIWVDGRIIFPLGVAAYPAHSDMPVTVRKVYEEAAAVFDLSPQAAAALLRLALEQLADHFGAGGDSISAKVGWLVLNKRLDPEVQQMLDSVRVIANHSIHPGEIDISGEDNRDTGLLLFEAINFIVDELITKPERRSKLWALVPEREQKMATQRDMKNRNSRSNSGDAA